MLAVAAALVAFATTGAAGRGDPAQRIAIVSDLPSSGAGVPPQESYVTRLQAARPGDQVVAITRSGATVRRWQITWSRALRHELRVSRPDVVVLALGGSDFYLGRPPTTFGDQLVELAGVVRAAVGDVELVFVHYYEPAARDLSACDIGACLILGQVAHVGGTPAGSLGGPLVESGVAAPWSDYGVAASLAAAQAGAGYVDVSTAAPWRSHLLGDRRHLGVEGHRLYAQALTEVIGESS